MQAVLLRILLRYCIILKISIFYRVMKIVRVPIPTSGPVDLFADRHSLG